MLIDDATSVESHYSNLAIRKIRLFQKELRKIRFFNLKKGKYTKDAREK